MQHDHEPSRSVASTRDGEAAGARTSRPRASAVSGSPTMLWTTRRRFTVRRQLRARRAPRPDAEVVAPRVGVEDRQEARLEAPPLRLGDHVRQSGADVEGRPASASRADRASRLRPKTALPVVDCRWTYHGSASRRSRSRTRPRARSRSAAAAPARRAAATSSVSTTTPTVQSPTDRTSCTAPSVEREREPRPQPVRRSDDHPRREQRARAVESNSASGCGWNIAAVRQNDGQETKKASAAQRSSGRPGKSNRASASSSSAVADPERRVQELRDPLRLVEAERVADLDRTAGEHVESRVACTTLRRRAARGRRSARGRTRCARPRRSRRSGG